MTKAAAVFKWLKGSSKATAEALKGTRFANKTPEELAKMFVDASDVAAQSRAELAFGKALKKHKNAWKVTKGQKVKADEKLMKDLDAVVGGAQAHARKIDRNKAVNTVAGLGLLGGAGYMYNEKQKRNQREQLLRTLTYPRM